MQIPESGPEQSQGRTVSATRRADLTLKKAKKHREWDLNARVRPELHYRVLWIYILFTQTSLFKQQLRAVLQ